MTKRRYLKEFAATNKAPYLGMPAGMIECRDVTDLPPDVQSIWLNRKSTGIELLPAFKRLQRIHAPLREEWLPTFARIPKLKFVKLSLPKSAEIPSLTCLGHLRTLVLSCNRHQTNLDFVRGMTWLHSLCVSEAMGVSSFDPLSTLSELRELYIDGKMSGRNTVDSFSPLAKLAHLQFAVLLVRLPKERRTLAPLRTLQQLNYLYLSYDYSAEEYDALLEALPQLKQIQFNGGRRWPIATQK